MNIKPNAIAAIIGVVLLAGWGLYLGFDGLHIYYGGVEKTVAGV